MDLARSRECLREGRRDAPRASAVPSRGLSREPARSLETRRRRRNKLRRRVETSSTTLQRDVVRSRSGRGGLPSSADAHRESRAEAAPVGHARVLLPAADAHRTCESSRSAERFIARIARKPLDERRLMYGDRR